MNDDPSAGSLGRAALALVLAAVTAPLPAQGFNCRVPDAAALATVDGAPVAVDVAHDLPAAGTLPAHCRIEGRTSGTIAYVLRVPHTWNHKLLMQGCQALCGYQATPACDDALARGYATLTTDTGHTASLIDARWAKDNPQARTDYGWRAVHLVALAGKELLATVAGERPARTYIRGCSNGGRQGLLEAERFPDTFDGVIAGASLMPGDGLLHLIWSARANLGSDGEPLLSVDDVHLLHKIVVRQCGNRDGLVVDPERCAIDPFAADFGRGTAAEGWTRAQREAVRRIYAGPHTRAGTPLTAGGPLPGSELTWESFVAPRGGRSLFETLGTDNLRYLAFEVAPPPELDARTFDFDRDAARVLASARPTRPSGDLRAFVARGGKVILYHGWADASVVPENTQAYAKAVRTSLGEALAATALRTYFLPGVGHCTETPGAGQVDWLTALEDWVERGRAPEGLVGHGQVPGGARTLTVTHEPQR